MRKKWGSLYLGLIKNSTHKNNHKLLIQLALTKINPVIYSHYLEEAKNLIMDKEDIPFVACALVFNCPVWSDDKHFQKQKKIKIFTTKDIMDLKGL